MHISNNDTIVSITMISITNQQRYTKQNGKCNDSQKCVNVFDNFH